MELKEDIVDIIVPYYKTEQGEINIANLKKSLEAVDSGFPHRLIIAEGKKPCAQNRNDGLRQSNSKYVLMCDEDIIFCTPNWLKIAIETIKPMKDVGL